jgi:hypothetical protein
MSANLFANGWSPGCWAGCRLAGIRPGWNRLAPRSSIRRRARHAHRAAGASARRPTVAGGLPGRLQCGRAPAVGPLGVTVNGIKVPLGAQRAPPSTLCGLYPAGHWPARPRPRPERGLYSSSRAQKRWPPRSAAGLTRRRSSSRRRKGCNVTDHLPEAERPLEQRRLRAAWATPDRDQGRAELEALARSLARQRPSRPPRLDPRAGRQRARRPDQPGAHHRRLGCPVPGM